MVFDPKQYKERAGAAALERRDLHELDFALRLQSVHRVDHGLQPDDAWRKPACSNLTPNGSEGSIWQSGGGLAADAQGNIYALIANGTFDTTLDANGFPNKQDYGNAFVKVSTTGGTLKVADYFNMSNTASESGAGRRPRFRRRHGPAGRDLRHGEHAAIWRWAPEKTETSTW